MATFVIKGPQVTYVSGVPVFGAFIQPSVGDLPTALTIMGETTTYKSAALNLDGTANMSQDVDGVEAGMKAYAPDGKGELMYLPLTAAQTASGVAINSGFNLAITDYTGGNLPVYTLTATAVSPELTIRTAIPAGAGNVLAWFSKTAVVIA